MGRQRAPQLSYSAGVAADNVLGGGSALAAKAALHAVQRFVALLHLHSALHKGGQVPEAPPLAAAGEAEFRAAEIKEGAEIDLFSRLSCTVCARRRRIPIPVHLSVPTCTVMHTAHS